MRHIRPANPTTLAVKGRGAGSGRRRRHGSRGLDGRRRRDSGLHGGRSGCRRCHGGLHGCWCGSACAPGPDSGEGGRLGGGVPCRGRRVSGGSDYRDGGAVGGGSGDCNEIIYVRN